MSLKSIVKVSHISNLSDARYCAGMGVEMLGFGVIPGQGQYMPPQVFQDIRGWISGPGIIAELYGISSPAEIATVVKTYSPDYFELALEEFLSFGEFLTLPCLVSVSDRKHLQTLSENDRIARIIVGEAVTCNDISGIRKPVLSHVGSLEKLNQRVNEGCFQGYVLEGPREIRPGVTNYDQLGLFLEALEDES